MKLLFAVLVPLEPLALSDDVELPDAVEPSDEAGVVTVTVEPSP
jgi:hypothetical protein